MTTTTSTSRRSSSNDPVRHDMIDTAQAAANLVDVRARIEAVGGDGHVEILAVTKGFGADIIDVAAAIGCGSIGENYS